MKNFSVSENEWSFLLFIVQMDGWFSDLCSLKSLSNLLLKGMKMCTRLYHSLPLLLL